MRNAISAQGVTSQSRCNVIARRHGRKYSMYREVGHHQGKVLLSNRSSTRLRIVDPENSQLMTAVTVVEAECAAGSAPTKEPPLVTIRRGSTGRIKCANCTVMVNPRAWEEWVISCSRKGITPPTKRLCSICRKGLAYL